MIIKKGVTTDFEQGEILCKVVVQVKGNPLTLAFLGFYELMREGMDLLFSALPVRDVAIKNSHSSDFSRGVAYRIDIGIIPHALQVVDHTDRIA